MSNEDFNWIHIQFNVPPKFPHIENIIDWILLISYMDMGNRTYSINTKDGLSYANILCRCQINQSDLNQIKNILVEKYKHYEIRDIYFTKFKT